LIIVDFVRFDGFSQTSRSFSSQKSHVLICDELQNHNLKLLTLLSPDLLIPSSNFAIIIDDYASTFYQHSKSNLLELPVDLLNSILSSPKLRIIDEGWLLDLFLSGCPKFMDLFCHLRVEWLSLNGMKRIFEDLNYSNVTEYIWESIVRRFTCSEDIEGEFTRCINPNGFESTVISGFPYILNELRPSVFELLYRGSRDGFRSGDFHRRCDGHNNTITLIRTTKDFVFGGYIPVSWDSTTNTYKADSSQRSFVFAILNPHGIGCRKFPLKPDQAGYAIAANYRYGPIFGNGNTICVYDNCSSTNGNYTDLTGYVNDTGLNDKVVFTGEYNFTVKEIEVFEVSELNIDTPHQRSLS
jgi:hypothetical protein